MKKKLYDVPNKHSKYAIENPGKRLSILLEFWEKLSRVRELRFLAHSKSKEGFVSNRRGKGEVAITKEGSHIIVFNEKGFWKGKNHKEIGFTNTFRWTLDRVSGFISLEHLRYGIEKPVFLFHLAPTALYCLSSIDPHLCNEDSYCGQVHFDSYHLKLNFRVIGPNKNEEIERYYL